MNGTYINKQQQQQQQQQQLMSTSAATEDDQVEEGSSVATFCEYRPTAVPTSVLRGEALYGGGGGDGLTVTLSPLLLLPLLPSHTSLACESNLLASVPAPAVLAPLETAAALLPLFVKATSANMVAVSAKMTTTATSNADDDDDGTDTANSPPLSPLQLEGALLAIQRHRRILLSGHGGGGVRAGFFLGDGAGVGKGRQISAIIRDSLCRRRRRRQQRQWRMSDTASDAAAPPSDNTPHDHTHPHNGRRRRHIWISVSRELRHDAKRDLADVGVHCDVHDGNSLLLEDGGGTLGQADSGVLFLTYGLLVSGRRLEQVVAWAAGTRQVCPGGGATGIGGGTAGAAGRNSTRLTPDANRKVRHLEHTFDGCIIFDEAHKAKNLSQDTRTARLVVELQARLPMARVVYCSATGVSDVAHLAYATRLGLWGTIGGNGGGGNGGSGFADFAQFHQSLEQRGLGSLELLAMEMKLLGSFLARTLSWEGAEFQTIQVPLSARQRLVYDQSVEVWRQCRFDMDRALRLLDRMAAVVVATASPTSTSNNGNAPSIAGMLWRSFWSAHQRFFKELAVCAKVPFLAQDALMQVHELGRCVVIGLQSTGEAGMQSLVPPPSAAIVPHRGNRDGEEVQHFPRLLSTVRTVFRNFVLNHFPVAPAPPVPPKLPFDQPPPPTASVIDRRQYVAIQAEIARVAALPPPKPVPVLLQIRQTLLDAIDHLDLPPNPLDDLVDRLGGPDHVAEMTGRSGRMVRSDARRRGGGFVFSKRVPATGGSKMAAAAASHDEASDRVNLLERKAFMDGTKAFAIISDAASTGISLHAARGSKGSHRRRVHYTIELPWSADKAVQQLGRSHRSGQESAPVYQLVVTDLGGERRFAAAVSKRMASLGALTKGDRRAATGSDMLSDFDLDSKYGKRALKRYYSALDYNERLLSTEDPSPVAMASALPSRNATAIIDRFILRTIDEKNDPILIHKMETQFATDPSKKYSLVFALAAEELDQIGLDKDVRKKSDVRVFLNRLAGLAVLKQELVFSLFMSTLDDVIKEAKSTGEFEGSAEDLKATTIEIDSEVELATDPTSGQQTKLTTLVLDRGMPFETACSMAAEEAVENADTEEEHDNTDQDGGDDEAETEAEMFSNAPSSDAVAGAGFYISRNKIAGRYLVLFAKRKFDRLSFKTYEEASNFDPLGLMVISRPNTGTNLTDMPQSELLRKYRLGLGCTRLKRALKAAKATLPKQATATALDTYEIVNRLSPKVAKLWIGSYDESNHFMHQNGLAPRRAKVSLVTGPVLHVLPTLEKAVLMRSERDKALKIMRAQVESRIVIGVRFPQEEDAIQKLHAELEGIRNARSTFGTTFADEDLDPICDKSLEWATSERKTMKSFFKVVGPSSPSNQPIVPLNRNGENGKSNDGKRSRSSVAVPTKKKAKNGNIASFFTSTKTL